MRASAPAHAQRPPLQLPLGGVSRTGWVAAWRQQPWRRLGRLSQQSAPATAGGRADRGTGAPFLWGQPPGRIEHTSPKEGRRH